MIDGCLTTCLFQQIENEENVLICLRIIIELHKQFRPPITQEVSDTLDSVCFELGCFCKDYIIHLMSMNQGNV